MTRDTELKPEGAGKDAMDKDGLWSGRLWSSGKGNPMAIMTINTGVDSRVPYEGSLVFAFDSLSDS